MPAAQGNYSYAHITGAATTVVKSSAGQVHSVNVNTAGTTVTVYDGASSNAATVVAVIGAVTGSFVLDADFASGIVVVTTGTPDVTITYQ